MCKDAPRPPRHDTHEGLRDLLWAEWAVAGWCVTLACRQRRQIKVGEMGARAEALEQDNSYLQGLLDAKNQEKRLLAM